MIENLKINLEIPGACEKVEEIINAAESQYPNDPSMQEHEIKKQIEAWLRIAEFKTSLSKKAD